MVEATPFPPPLHYALVFRCNTLIMGYLSYLCVCKCILSLYSTGCLRGGRGACAFVIPVFPGPGRVSGRSLPQSPDGTGGTKEGGGCQSQAAASLRSFCEFLQGDQRFPHALELQKEGLFSPAILSSFFSSPPFFFPLPHQVPFLSLCFLPSHCWEEPISYWKAICYQSTFLSRAEGL